MQSRSEAVCYPSNKKGGSERHCSNKVACKRRKTTERGRPQLNNNNTGKRGKEGLTQLQAQQVRASIFFYKMEHLPFFLLGLARAAVSRAMTQRMDSSKTALRPFCVSAEHSRYLNPFSSSHFCWPADWEIGLHPLARNCAMVSSSSRRSILVPTRMKGVVGA